MSMAPSSWAQAESPCDLMPHVQAGPNFWQVGPEREEGERSIRNSMVGKKMFTSSSREPRDCVTLHSAAN